MCAITSKSSLLGQDSLQVLHHVLVSPAVSMDHEDHVAKVNAAVLLDQPSLMTNLRNSVLETVLLWWCSIFEES